MLPTQELHLDHSDPRDKDRLLPGDRIVHGTCNRRGLARLTPPDTNATIIREW